VGALALSLTAAWPFGLKAQEPVKIGVVYPLSGGLARTGAAIKATLEFTTDIVNNPHPKLGLIPLASCRGLSNLGNRPIELIFADSAGDPATGRAEAERLIEEKKVVALIGCYQSSVTKTASIPAEARGIPFLNAESSSPTLTERGFKWFFRTGPHDVTFSRLFFDMFDDLREQGHEIRRLAILSEDSEWGASAVDVEKRFAAERGYEIVAVELYTTPPASLDAELLRIREANPDALLGQQYLPGAILVVQTLKEMGWFPPGLVVHDAGYVLPDFLKTVGADGNYILSRAAWALALQERKPLVKAVNDLHKERVGTSLDGVTARSFTGLITLADAINRAGSTEPEAIRQALVETNIPGERLIMPWKGIEFDEKGQNKHAAGVMVQISEQQYKLVWPFDLAETDLIWPAPGWAER
jgi:branched-chain amino acid transport system substrate-binding protein